MLVFWGCYLIASLAVIFAADQLFPWIGVLIAVLLFRISDSFQKCLH